MGEAASVGEEEAPGAGDMSVAVPASEAGAAMGWVVMSGDVDAAVFPAGLAIDSLAADATESFAPSSLLQADTASARETVQARISALDFMMFSIPWMVIAAGAGPSGTQANSWFSYPACLRVNLR